MDTINFMKASLIKITFDYANTFHCEYLELPYFNHPWHFHPEIELTLILEGNGTRYVGNNISRFTNGDLVLLGSGLPHLWESDRTDFKSNQKGAKAVVLQFSKDLTDTNFKNSAELHALSILLKKADRGLLFSKKFSAQVTPKLIEISKTFGLRKWTLVFELFCLLTETKDYIPLTNLHYEPNLKSRDSTVINNIFEYVRLNFKNKITLDDIAGIAHLSKPAFCRYFKKKTSKSFIDFLNAYRIGHAKNLLRDKPHMTIGNIAFESGFPSIQHFNSKFKKYENLTPKAYRKKWAQSN